MNNYVNTEWVEQRTGQAFAHDVFNSHVGRRRLPNERRQLQADRAARGGHTRLLFALCKQEAVTIRAEAKSRRRSSKVNTELSNRR